MSLTLVANSFASAVVTDARARRARVVLLRAGRMARGLWHGAASSRVLANPVARRHVLTVAPGDHFFFLSHRHYLARGLTTEQRTAAADGHYAAEAARPDAPPRPRLWWEQVAGTSYTIDLTLGQDVLYEGGLSVVLSVDGGRVAVLSGSFVPRTILGLPGPGLIPFVTRLHRAQDHSYQTAFHKAFDRVTPVQLLLGAWTGIAQARGHDQFFGIAGRRHPSWIADYADAFDSSYDQTWRAAGGVEMGTMGFIVPAPLRHPPLEGLPAAKRKRAIARRAHVAAVAEAARLADG